MSSARYLNGFSVLPTSAKRHSSMLKDINQYSKEELYEYLELLVDRIERPNEPETVSQDAARRPGPTDPLHELLSAAHNLQEDVVSIIKKFRDLSLDLEQEVSARTEQLQIKEANLTALIENTSDLILSVDHTLQIRVINTALRRKLQRVSGASLRVGDNLQAHFEPSVVDEWRDYFEKALEGHSFKIEKQFPYDAHILYLELSFNPIWERNGIVSGVSIFGKDITEKQIALEEIKAQQQLLASINYSIKEGIFRSMTGRGILYVNKAFVEMFGYDSEEEVLALEPYELYTERSRRDDFVHLIREQGFFINEEVQFKRKDGSTFWGLMSSIKSYDKNGNILHDGAIRDITELKHTKAQLAQQNHELIKVNQELDRFVYSTSHDLRAPLVSLKGLIDITRLSDSETEQQMYLGLMETSIDRLDGFIQDIIAYSRNSRTEVNCKPLDLAQITSNCFENLRYLNGAEEVDLTVHMEPESSLFASDETRLNIILNNLITNAIRYRDPQKAQCLLDIDIHVSEEFAQIKITDNGVGISEGSLPRIFEMFYRGNRDSKGSGIGLYIVKETLNRLDGRIEVASTEGVGTTFTLILPHLSTVPPKAG